MTETAVAFGKDALLTGILTDPPVGYGSTQRPAIVLLNAGISHRSGPNRFYVTLARHLAARGSVVFRFDFAGIGDSAVSRNYASPRNRSIRNSIEAMNHLQAMRGARTFVLIGLCYGAVVAFETALCDERVVAAVLLNAQGFLFYAGRGVEAELVRRRAFAYYANAFRHLDKWRRLFTGKTSLRRIFETIRGDRLTECNEVAHCGKGEIDRLRAGFATLCARSVRLMFLYSEGDAGLSEIGLILAKPRAMKRRNPDLDFCVIRNADHVFTLIRHRTAVLDRILRWL